MAEREQYQRDMRRANEVMDQMQRDDPEAWQEYLSELRSVEDGTIRDGLTEAASDRWAGRGHRRWRMCAARSSTS